MGGGERLFCGLVRREVDLLRRRDEPAERLRSSVAAAFPSAGPSRVSIAPRMANWSAPSVWRVCRRAMAVGLGAISGGGEAAAVTDEFCVEDGI